MPGMRGRLGVTGVRRREPVSLRRHVLVPVVGSLLLLAAFAAAVLILMWHLQREQLRARHEEAVDALATLIGRELETSRNQLEYVATSPAIGARDVEAFARRCEELLRIRSDWTSVILIDAKGNQRINTSVPPGHALPRGVLQAHHARVLETGRPQVSGIFRGAASGRWTVAASVPVQWNAASASDVLSVGIAPESFDALLEQRVRSTHGTAMLLDADYRVIARTARAAVERGSVAPPQWRDAVDGHRQGSARQGMVMQGTLPLTSMPIPHTGWWVVVDTPTSASIGMLGRYLGALSIGTLLVLAIAVSIFVHHALGIARHISQMVERALAVAGGAPTRMPESSVLELNKLADAVSRYAQSMTESQHEKARLLADEQAARARADAANQSKDDLLATLSHELRTPLAAISTSVQLLRHGAPPNESSAFALAVISRQAAHLTKLVDTLLDAARVSRGELKLERQPLELAPLVEEAVADVRAANAADQRRYVVATQPVRVLGDRTGLRQIVVNLVSNAIKHTPDGGTISIAVRPRSSQAEIEVSDTGIGLAAEHLTRIFDPFYRVSSEAKDGLGIGLAFVKRVAEGHGGSVTARSEGPGSGATFTVTLPCAPGFA